jgi:AICAR transformylase/IMP cyclohydrolase PurH
MVRASAKNYLRVVPVTDPADYGALWASCPRRRGPWGLPRGWAS